MIKCRNCEYGEILEVFTRDRVTKVKTQMPSGWALCSRPRAKSEKKYPAKDAKRKCKYFSERTSAERQED